MLDCAVETTSKSQWVMTTNLYFSIVLDPPYWSAGALLPRHLQDTGWRKLSSSLAVPSGTCGHSSCHRKGKRNCHHSEAFHFPNPEVTTSFLLTCKWHWIVTWPLAGVRNLEKHIWCLVSSTSFCHRHFLRSVNESWPLVLKNCLCKIKFKFTT